jgi:hypothetical protein
MHAEPKVDTLDVGLSRHITRTTAFITIDPKPDPGPELENGNGGNGSGGEIQQRAWRRRMALIANFDGSLVIEPDPGHSLVVLGDADEMVVIGEVADGE